MGTLRPMRCFDGPHGFVYIFASCVVTQQNATYFRVAHPGGGLRPPNSKLAEIFVRRVYPQVSSSYVYSFGSYRVDKQTNTQTHKQTDYGENIQRSSLGYDVG